MGFEKRWRKYSETGGKKGLRMRPRGSSFLRFSGIFNVMNVWARKEHLQVWSNNAEWNICRRHSIGGHAIGLDNPEDRAATKIQVWLWLTLIKTKKHSVLFRIFLAILHTNHWLDAKSMFPVWDPRIPRSQASGEDEEGGFPGGHQDPGSHPVSSMPQWCTVMSHDTKAPFRCHLVLKSTYRHE